MKRRAPRLRLGDRALGALVLVAVAVVSYLIFRGVHRQTPPVGDAFLFL